MSRAASWTGAFVQRSWCSITAAFLLVLTAPTISAQDRVHLSVFLVTEAEAAGPLAPDDLVRLRHTRPSFDIDLPLKEEGEPHEMVLPREFLETLRSTMERQPPSDPNRRRVALFAFRWAGTSPKRINSFKRTAPPAVPPSPPFSLNVMVPRKWNVREVVVALEPSRAVIWRFAPVRNRTFAFMPVVSSEE